MIPWMGEVHILNLAVETVCASSGDSVSFESRENNVLFYVMEGTRDYLKSSEKRFSVQPNHLLLLPTGSNYLSVSTSPSVGLGVDFSLQNSAHEEIILDTFPTILAADRSGYYARQIQQVYHCIQAGGPALLKAKSLLYDMLYTFSLQQTRQDGDRRSLLPAVQHMETHLNESVSIQQLAELCHMSKSTFHRRFQEVYRTTPARWHMDLRIQKSRELLLSGLYSVEAVAEEMGFCDTAHFSRTFHQLTGLHAGTLRNLRDFDTTA